MDLTAWFGPQGVFSTGDAAHIFGFRFTVHGSGPVLLGFPPCFLPGFNVM
jgi:hypothetical protein